MDTVDDLIEKYIQGTLSTEEKALLEQKTQEDPSISNKIALEKGLFAASNDTDWASLDTTESSKRVADYQKRYQDKETKALQKAIAEAAERYQLKQNKKNFSWKPFIGIAAMIAIGLFIFNSITATPSAQELYASNLNATLATEWQRSDTITDPFVETGKEAYENKDYPKAIQALEQALQTTKNQSMDHYALLAVSYGENHQEAKGIALLKSLPKGKYTDEDKIDWLQALLLLKQKKIAESSRILTQIQNSDSDYQKEAKTLLEQLD